MIDMINWPFDPVVRGLGRTPSPGERACDNGDCQELDECFEEMSAVIPSNNLAGVGS